jgi:hypothetical protein
LPAAIKAAGNGVGAIREPTASTDVEGTATLLAEGEANGHRHAIRERVTVLRDDRLPRGTLISFLLSTGFRRGSHMNWFYWHTAWSLLFSLVWFMTITHNPDAQIAEAHLRDEALGG